MTWQQWVLIGYFAVGVVATIWMIGKEREPITPGTAIATLVLSMASTWLVVSI